MGSAGLEAGAAAWAHSAAGFQVSNCESGDRHAFDVATRYNGNAHLQGYYQGKWQADADFWRTYGGLQYASSPVGATESEQDAVAYRGYQARGWGPWECAGIMGLG